MNCIGCGKSEYRYIVNQYTRLCESCVAGMYDSVKVKKYKRDTSKDKIYIAFIVIGIGLLFGGLFAII